MKPAFLGKGWRFPILPDVAGRLAYTEGEENIEQSVRLLLLTEVGERVMRQEFGCRAAQLVFAPGGQRHLRLLETTVRDAIRDWEPRVEVIDVAVEADVKEPERVNVLLSYRVRATDTKANLVFPFYLNTIESR
jgi:phage baseplate assembly protein W